MTDPWAFKRNVSTTNPRAFKRNVSITEPWVFKRNVSITDPWAFKHNVSITDPWAFKRNVSTTKSQFSLIYSWIEFLDFLRRAVPLSRTNNLQVMQTPPSRPVWETKEPLQSLTRRSQVIAEVAAADQEEEFERQQKILSKLGLINERKNAD